MEGLISLARIGLREGWMRFKVKVSSIQYQVFSIKNQVTFRNGN